MTHASEIRKIWQGKMDERVNAGKSKAFAALDVIDTCVHMAAENCASYADVHVIRLTTFDNETERQAYIATLKVELRKLEYKVTFCQDSGVMRIAWDF